MDLVWVGGAKGTGKSTVVNILRDKYGLRVVNTGDLIRSDRGAGEKVIVDYLNNGFVGVVDTHYVGYKGSGLVRALSKENLFRIKGDIGLFLIDLDSESLLERRTLDECNARILDISSIKDELFYSRFYFHLYEKELGVRGNVLYNLCSSDSAEKIVEAIKNGK